jgi:SNF2 family DNA or RNA helicase
MDGIKLTHATLERELPAEYLARGKMYADAGQVSDLRRMPGHGHYAAKVQGSRARPYSVIAQLIKRATGIMIYGQCTCPVRINCKHVAAMLYAVIDRPAADKVDTHPTPLANSTKPVAAQSSDMPHELSAWLASARRIAQPNNKESAATANPQCLLYLLDTGAQTLARTPVLKLVNARRLKDGAYSGATPWGNLRPALSAPPRFVSKEDQRVFRMLLIDGRSSYVGEFALPLETGAEIVRAALATGRCHWTGIGGAPLREGPPRAGRAAWEFSNSGAQRMLFKTEPDADVVLPFSPPWYVDTKHNECGPLDAGLTPALAGLLARAPEIAPEYAAAARAALSDDSDASSVPLPSVPEVLDRRDIVPRPCLQLLTLQVLEDYRGSYRWREEFLDIAVLTFDYAGTRTSRDSPALLSGFQAGKVVRIKRHSTKEKQVHAELTSAGFARIKQVASSYPREHEHDYTLAGQDAWLDFMVSTLPQLRTQGWNIEIQENFRFATVDAGDWLAEIEEAGQDWFDLSLEVEVEGSRINLVPLLLTLIREKPELLRQSKAGSENKTGHLFVRLESGRMLPVPFARMQPLISVLHDLLDHSSTGKLRLPRLDALRLADLNDSVALKWQGGEALRELGRKLAEFKTIVPVLAPEDFDARLRPYQEQGLAWLQFLREYGLGGILADDMGLGKTVQTLAHVLIEKQAGRLTHPALVVAPTSVVPNWKAEAARFAPQLRVHVSHGLKRKEAFAEIGASDLVLTTYALLPRDEEVLLAQEFHLVILDEAQQIKNALTRAARVVGKLRARHRLCLTGTPLENHLGELWSLFHFLMPGLLGDAVTFRRAYRTPIEKNGDAARRQNLVRRIRPFLMRRTKDQVATELPLKSEILRPVELAGPQRELYETVRASMHERVRAEIAARGLAQSHIIVLDALLKLRQICCDPRLLKLDTAKRIKESAKLELLLYMLQEMVPEGRRILIFSQFTSMLELIEPELAKLKFPHVKLTGQTRDRERPVKEFQAGKVPLFLVSLKAGGTGLNLTAADTVIHYDPWWNPAVENQATGRAHRIGQDKPVFVYKLIVTGTVEEKIAALQSSKSALARGVLENDASAALPLSADDIQALFEPLA